MRMLVVGVRVVGPVAPAPTVSTVAVVLGTWPALSERYVERLTRLSYMSGRNLLVLDEATLQSYMKESTNSKKSFRRSPVRARVIY